MAIHRERRTAAKTFLAEMILCQLAMEGRTSVTIHRNILEDDMWNLLEVKTVENDEANTITVEFHIKGFTNRVQEAEYEIVEEPPKQFPPHV